MTAALAVTALRQTVALADRAAAPEDLQTGRMAAPVAVALLRALRLMAASEGCFVAL